RLLHSIAADAQLATDIAIATSLLNIHGKIGSLAAAKAIFHSMEIKSVIAWTAMMAACVHHRENREALVFFRRMLLEHSIANTITFVTVLGACGNCREGASVHEWMIESGVSASSVFASTAIVTMYGRCGSVGHAKEVFDSIVEKNFISWNAMVAAFAQNRHCAHALAMVRSMDLEGLHPDRVTWLSVLGSVAEIDIRDGRWIHSRILGSGIELDFALGTALLNMYARNHSLEEALEIFDGVEEEERDLPLWGTMIAGYADDFQLRPAMALLRRMQHCGVLPSKVVIVAMINLCAAVSDLRQGEIFRALFVESCGIDRENSAVVANALVDMYGKCGELSLARKLFREIPEKDSVSWNSILVVGNALISAFGKCSSPGNAREIFDAMIERNKVSWTAIIAAYAHSHYGAIAKLFFRRMLLQGEEPDRVTFATILSTCTTAAALVEGKRFHALLAERPAMEMDPVVVSALIHMYSKCGSLESASKVFDRGRSFLLQENLLVWTSVISAYAHHGDGERALKLFARMQQAGLRADGVTILSVLSACAKAGMLETGIQFFASIARDHCLEVTLEHYSCLVDLLGRAGELSAAQELVRRIPNARAYVSFLSSCSVQGDVELGRAAAEKVSVLDPSIPAGYVVLSNL
ncbi:hypothetical protein SELMODRAFT_541, partial [Selaginella moellendorffii]